MADLRAPQSFATDFGTVIARAQQAAATQSAQILTAANNIARSRERAGQAAKDAQFRMRMEEFNRQQFAQKARVENARLAIAQDANARAQSEQPLRLRGLELANDLKQVAVNDAPLRTAILGQNLVGQQLQNSAAATNLEFLPERLRTQQAQAAANLGLTETRSNLLASDAALQVQKNEQELERSNKQAAILGDLNALASTKPSLESTLQGTALIERLARENRVEIGLNPELTQVYNDAVDRLGMNESFKIQNAGVPQAPEGFDVTGFQTSTSADGRTSSQAQFARSDLNAQPSQLEVNRRIDAIRENSDAQSATFQRELKSVNEEITALNKVMSSKSSSKSEKQNAASRLEKLRNQRSLLEGDLRGLEDQTAKAVNDLITLGQEDIRPGGLPGIAPTGPDATLVGNPDDVLSIFN